MSQADFSLNDLAERTGIEPRTIRSYIERGLLPGAHARGRGASYSSEHLSRLQVIQSLRRARPNMALSEIRIVLQQLKPQQIHSLAGGSIGAVARAISDSAPTDDIVEGEYAVDDGETPRTVDWDDSARKLTGAERLVCFLREMGGLSLPARTSRVEAWNRISVTPDVELSVRAEFDENQVAAFRQLAELLGHLLQHTDALVKRIDE